MCARLREARWRGGFGIFTPLQHIAFLVSQKVASSENTKVNLLQIRLRIQRENQLRANASETSRHDCANHDQGITVATNSQEKVLLWPTGSHLLFSSHLSHNILIICRHAFWRGKAVSPNVQLCHPHKQSQTLMSGCSATQLRLDVLKSPFRSKESLSGKPAAHPRTSGMFRSYNARFTSQTASPKKATDVAFQEARDFLFSRFGGAGTTGFPKEQNTW